MDCEQRNANAQSTSDEDPQKIQARLAALSRLVAADLRPAVFSIHELLESKQGAVDASTGRHLSSVLDRAAIACSIALAKLDMLGDLLLLEAGRLELVRSECHLETLLRQTVEGLAVPLAPLRRIPGDNSPPASVSCDLSLIRRVIRVLLSRALRECAGGGGDIRYGVRADRHTSRVYFTYPLPSQDGPEKSGQSSGTRADETRSSTDIGLAFCRGAVEAHGGEMGCEPVADRRAAYWFELPTLARA